MDQLAEIRRQQAQKWREEQRNPTAASAPTKKPEEVVIGGKKITSGKKQWTMSEYAEILDTYCRIRHQATSQCPCVNLDYSSTNFFQSFLRLAGFSIHRRGRMYGTVNPDNSINVDCIYEPSQEYVAGDCLELEDPKLTAVDQLAHLMGLRPVGWIVSHGPREEVLTGAEIISTAEMMSKYGRHCTVVVVNATDTGEINVEAYQVSEQCLKLYEEKTLSAHPTNKAYIHSTRPLEAVQEGADAKKGCIIREATKDVEGTLFTVPVAIKQYESTVTQNNFVRLNRPDYRPSLEDLKRFLTDPKRQGQPFWQKINDFHVLVFLMDLLDIKTDYPGLCEGILQKSDENFVGIKLIIGDRCGMEL